MYRTLSMMVATSMCDDSGDCNADDGDDAGS